MFELVGKKGYIIAEDKEYMGVRKDHKIPCTCLGYVSKDEVLTSLKDNKEFSEYGIVHTSNFFISEEYIGINDNRLKHSLAVAKRCYTLALEYVPGDINFARKMFEIGFNHDIGYEFTSRKEKSEHGRIGSMILEHAFGHHSSKGLDAIKYHGNPETPSEYRTIEWYVLNHADLTINSKGEEVTMEERLEDIKEKNGTDSTSYNDARIMVQVIKNYSK